MLLCSRRLLRHQTSTISGGAPALLLWALIVEPAGAWTGDRSVPLQELLQEITRSGVQLIYSSETITPELRAIPPPPEMPLEARLQAILGPLQLEAQRLPTGGYVIVRSSGHAPALEIVVTMEREGTVSLLPGAEVTLTSIRRHARTDHTGRVLFADLNPAEYLVEVKFDGLREVRRTVRIAPDNGTAGLEVRLLWEPIPLEEIMITSNRYDAGATLGVTMARETLENIPSTSGDAARSLQLLPGAAVAGYSAKTHVRGSRDDETLFRYDGLTLTDPYHLEAFQSLLSAIDPAVIESTTSWTGVAPIQFGERIGAVVDIEPRAITGGSIDAKLSNREAGLLLGAPFAADRGTVFAAARLSNAYSPAQWAEPDGLEPKYRDDVLRVTWQAGPRTRLSVGALALDDERDTLSSNTMPTDQRARVDTRERYTWLRLIHEFNPSIHSDTLVSQEASENIVNGRLNLTGIENGFLAKRDRISAWSLREELTLSPASQWSLLIGAERSHAAVENMAWSRVDFAPSFVPGLQPIADVQQDSDISLRAAASSIYGRVQWQASDATLADFGIRRDSRQYDRMTGGDSHWSVRASLRQRLSEDTMVRLGWGQTAQASVFDVSRAADGWVQPAPARLLNQINLSVEQIFANHWFLRSEAYDKREHSPFQVHEDVASPFTLLPEIAVGNQLIPTRGARLYGFETRLESDRSRPLSGWLSYSWSRAEDAIAGQWVPRSWDQPNAVQLGTRWRQGPWKVSGVFSWHSGWPYTPLVVSSTAGPTPTAASTSGSVRRAIVSAWKTSSRSIF